MMQPETNDFMCQSCLQVIKENLYDAFYRLTSPKTQITAYVFDVVRAIVPKSDLDDVFITKDEASLRLCCVKLRTSLPPPLSTKLYICISTGDARSHDLSREFQSQVASKGSGLQHVIQSRLCSSGPGLSAP